MNAHLAALCQPDMPSRILREGILTSERVAALSWPAEVFYRRLHSVVDDFGRYFAKPMALRAACYPMQLDRVKDAEIEKWLLESSAARLIKLYDVDGQTFLELLDFHQQIRAKKSRFPDPVNGTEHQMQASATHTQAIVLDESKVVESLPLIDGSSFDVTENFLRELDPLYPEVDPLATIREMKGWLIGNPTRKKKRTGIKRFITTWLKNEQEKHSAKA